MKTIPDSEMKITRVVVDAEGYATNRERAKKEHNIEPAVVFVRHDGWTLGAPRPFVDIAQRLWKDDWVAIYERRGDLWRCTWDIEKGLDALGVQANVDDLP